MTLRRAHSRPACACADPRRTGATAAAHARHPSARTDPVPGGRGRHGGGRRPDGERVARERSARRQRQRRVHAGISVRRSPIVGVHAASWSPAGSGAGVVGRLGRCVRRCGRRSDRFVPVVRGGHADVRRRPGGGTGGPVRGCRPGVGRPALACDRFGGVGGHVGRRLRPTAHAMGTSPRQCSGTRTAGGPVSVRLAVLRDLGRRRGCPPATGPARGGRSGRSVSTTCSSEPPGANGHRRGGDSSDGATRTGVDGGVADCDGGGDDDDAAVHERPRPRRPQRLRDRCAHRGHVRLLTVRRSADRAHRSARIDHGRIRRARRRDHRHRRVRVLLGHGVRRSVPARRRMELRSRCRQHVAHRVGPGGDPGRGAGGGRPGDELVRWRRCLQ